MLPDSAEVRPRPRIGRYLIVGRIGRGGMGRVYRGLDEALQREVAVKTLIAEGALDEESRRRFQREAQSAARLQHPNIVTVYELSEDRGVPFIALELLTGMDLEALVRSGEELLLAEKLDIVIQVCRGLAYAHERGIVHRDIKPSNIRLLDDGTAKIMDFGIAKLIEGTQLTKTGMMLGTIHYMSPEQVQARKPLDGRSDVFSLGVILHELLTGARPFRAEGQTAVLYKIVHDAAPPLDTAALGEIGPRLQAILDRALAKDAAARYPGAAELAAELSEALALHRRSLGHAPTLDLRDAVTAARRTLGEGRVEEATARLEALVEAHPHAVEARRALRTLRRDVDRRRRPPEPEGDEYPELEATFAAPPTARAAETELQPTVVVEPGGAPTGAPARRPLLLIVGVAAAALVATVAALLLLGRPAAPAEVRLPVRSQPIGASVLVDGRESGVVTNGEIVIPAPVPPRVVLLFRKPGHREETRTVSLPMPAGESVSVTLEVASKAVPARSEPAGATVSVDGERLAGVTPLELTLDPAEAHTILFSLEGHEPQEVALPAGETPAEVRVRLEPVADPGTVVIASGYPVDVIWRGRTLARGETQARVQVAEGRQVLTLVAAGVFLRRQIELSVPSGGEVAVSTPALGRISIRAVPDTCRVFIDGAFVDYPPILERAVSSGEHRVSFRWPDGSESEETVEVAPGATAYAMGRKGRP